AAATATSRAAMPTPAEPVSAESLPSASLDLVVVEVDLVVDVSDVPDVPDELPLELVPDAAVSVDDEPVAASVLPAELPAVSAV
ncbi:hypothetical protein LPJ59_006470, partial [Coemansia sp. RSA 2399]